MLTPKVSVAILTYNHQNFLKQALDGILLQKTNFEIEIIVADDASTDNTQDILRTYEANNPNIFKICYRTKNIGMLPNFLNMLNDCSGKYIAFCEGDDYWTDPLKLQKQVDFLEKNLDYGICFHNVMVFDEATKSLNEDDITTNNKNDFNSSDLVKGNFMHTPSVLLRNDFEIPLWLKTSPIGDWPLYISQIKNRKIKKLEDTMGVYRVHQTSAWSSKSDVFKIRRTITTINLILENIDLNKTNTNYLLKKRDELKFDYKAIKGSNYKQLKKYFRNLFK